MFTPVLRPARHGQAAIHRVRRFYLPRPRRPSAWRQLGRLVAQLRPDAAHIGDHARFVVDVGKRPRPAVTSRLPTYVLQWPWPGHLQLARTVRPTVCREGGSTTVRPQFASGSCRTACSSTLTSQRWSFSVPLLSYGQLPTSPPSTSYLMCPFLQKKIQNQGYRSVTLRSSTSGSVKQTSL